ncbi:FAD/NAD(P)-binding protein [Halalkalibacter urbisdiaboli]|uniref:FAD/NAD(P)-binding protein n=1 Tax=Halalkalibacter urbisdiaboli TaxID=1960589 RepID=UPI000B437DDB|nr:FAD/NAD(P)-binding protein [Halalkalibacter urbisdiaboli]
MFNWTIIGGGIQGMTLVAYLQKKLNIKTSELAIIDPHQHPLSMWKRCTSNIGMTYLRSPSIHHLDPNPFALEIFEKSKRGKNETSFVQPYSRPSLSLFNMHCEHLFETLHVADSWIQDRVQGIEKKVNGWEIKLSSRKILTKHVVLAIGLSEQPVWPAWAEELKMKGANIKHQFEDLDSNPSAPLLIAGGGISAAHSALLYTESNPGKVTLLTRHPLQVFQFDSDPAWLGPKKMRLFLKAAYQKRRQFISEARHRGSMPGEVRVRLRKAESEQRLVIKTAEVQSTSFNNQLITLVFSDGESWEGKSIRLATGFHTSAPGMNWLINEENAAFLHCHTCGYPILNDATLEWAPNLYVMGALAELSLGPVARNISGARRGAERIIRSISK